MKNRELFGAVHGLAAVASLAGFDRPALAAPAVDIAKDVATLSAMNDAFNAAVKAKDASWIAATDTDDTVAWFPGPGEQF